MKYYTQISENEREKIYLLIQKNYNNKEIAKELGRHPSSIGREIQRNSSLLNRNLNNCRGDIKEDKNNYHYLPDSANNKYKNRKKEAGKCRPILKGGDFLYIVESIKKGYSPEIISGRMELEGKGKISHEAIYQFIYNKDYKHLKLREYLPQRRRKRRAKKGRKGRKINIPNRIDISARDDSINKRIEIGHWEGDSIEGKRGTGACLHVSTERYSRLTRIRKIKQKTSLNTIEVMKNIFYRIPDYLRKTSTLDNGSEFTSWEIIKKELGMIIYFTYPYSSWEKGTVERINGFIRRFFPKGTDFNNVTDEQIQFVEDWINNRPMSCLNFKTPNEVFQNAIHKN